MLSKIYFNFLFFYFSKSEVIIEYGQSENLTKSVLKSSEKKMYCIGRKADSEILINDNRFSREQAMIYYENNNWYIKDGSIEKPSSSGTWLYVDKKFQINNSFVFKLGTSKMKLDLIENNSNNSNNNNNKNVNSNNNNNNNSNNNSNNNNNNSNNNSNNNNNNSNNNNNNNNNSNNKNNNNSNNNSNNNFKDNKDITAEEVSAAVCNAFTVHNNNNNTNNTNNNNNNK